MITQIELTNFRGFPAHTVPFEPRTIMVGRNNAGKSTIVEALRLVAIVASRYRTLTYFDPPGWLDLAKRMRGVSPSLRGTGIFFPSLFHRYEDPPAIVTATFGDRSTITVYVGGEDLVHAVIADPSGAPVRTRAEAIHLDLPAVRIQPQVAPVSPSEVIRDPDYLRRVSDSYLAPSHFRNRLWLSRERMSAYESKIQETWPGISIDNLDGGEGFPGDPLTLTVRDHDFVAEVAWMGHGLQMWLQLMWFLTVAEGDETVILDEPDVYMHPDLQRTVIKYLKRQHSQLIVATHSVEIVSESDPSEILIIDRERPKSRFAGSLAATQKLVDRIGGVHSLQLARLWGGRRCLLVEGKDVRLLKALHDKLFPTSLTSLDAISNMSIGGWGGWNYAIGSSMLLKNEAGDDIRTFCILDRDYHTEQEIIDRRAEARRRNVELHIWARKEIENYLIVPDVLERLIRTRVSRRTNPPTLHEMDSVIDTICEAMREDVEDAIATEVQARERKGLKAANQKARSYVRGRWSSRDGRLSVVSGKELISRLSDWSQVEFGVSFGASTIAREIRAAEIAPEVVSVIAAIEENTPVNVR